MEGGTGEGMERRERVGAPNLYLKGRRGPMRIWVPTCERGGDSRSLLGGLNSEKMDAGLSMALVLRCMGDAFCSRRKSFSAADEVRPPAEGPTSAALSSELCLCPVTPPAAKQAELCVVHICSVHSYIIHKA